MFTRIRSRLTYANVASSIALFAALGTGGAYAANTVGSSDIIDNSVASVDLKDGDIKAVDIGVGQVLGSRIVDETVKTEDLADDRVASADLKDGDVRTSDLQDDAVRSDKIQDFSLSNQDVGVLFAEVNAVGTLGGSSGFGVTATKLLGEGQYEVDFGRTVAGCTSVATLGSSTTTTQSGEVNVADRGGNAEAVFVDTNNSAGAALDRAFRLVVVC